MSEAARSAWLRGTIYFLTAWVFLGWNVLGPDSIGNDYVQWYTYPPVYYRFFARYGILPTWYPHFSGGIPWSGNSLPQYFQLPAWIFNHLPGFGEGRALRFHALQDLTLFAGAQAMVAEMLRKAWTLSFGVSFLGSLVIVYNLRSLDALRYGGYWEATAYLIFLTGFAVGFLRRPTLFRLIGFGFSVQCFLSCGYAPMLIHATVAALGLFCAALLTPIPDRIRRLGALAVSGALALLIAAPQWLEAVTYSKLNFKRLQATDLAWADAYRLELPFFIDGFIRPWAAEVHSGFFASTLLAILFIAIPIHLVSGARGRLRWAALVFLAVPFLYAFGSPLGVAAWFFRLMPGFRFVRVPGRMISIVTPLALAFALLIDGDRARFRRALLIGAGALTGALGVALALEWLRPNWLAGLDRVAFTPQNLSPAYWNAGHRAVWQLAGLVTGAAVLLGATGRRARLAVGIAITATLLQTGMLYRHGTWIQSNPHVPTFTMLQEAEQLPLYGLEHPTVNELAGDALTGTNDLSERDAGLATIDYTRFFKSAGAHRDCYYPVRQPPPGDGRVKVPFYLMEDVACVADPAAMDARIASTACPTGVAPVIALAADCARFGLGEHPGTPRALNEGNRLLGLSPNGLAMRFEAPRAAVLRTPFPWAEGAWRATVNGAQVSPIFIDDGWVGVPIPAGTARVIVYRNAFRFAAGLKIAAGTGALVLLLAAGLGWARRESVAGIETPHAAVATLGAIGLAVTALFVMHAATYAEAASRMVKLPSGYANLLRDQLQAWDEGFRR